MTAWHTENFRRAGKNLKNLGEYLKPPAPERQRLDEEARALRDMIAQRRARKKEAVDGV